MIKWKFPHTIKATCDKCKKPFDIILRNRQDTDHACPDCGTAHTFDFKKADEDVKKALKKQFGSSIQF